MRKVRFVCRSKQCKHFDKKEIVVDAEVDSDKDKLWKFVKEHDVSGTWGY